MAIFNEGFIKDWKNKKKSKKEYHHLNKSEITSCINIAKECIKDFPKLKKASNFINIYKKDEYIDDYSPIEKYYKGPGDSDLDIIDGDAWDGYPTLRTNTEEFMDDEIKFQERVNEKILSQNIKAKFFGTGGCDWDGIKFAITSLKEK